MVNHTRRKLITEGTAVATTGGIISIAGCIGGENSGTDLTFAAGGSGSGTFSYGQMIQALMRDHTDHRITTQETGGQEANTRLFQEDEDIDFIGTSNYALTQAYNEEPPFNEISIEREFQQGWSYGITHAYVVARADTDIETYSDLNGVDFWPFWPGSTQRLPVEVFLQEIGLWENLNIINISQEDVAGALEEERIEAICVYGSNYQDIVSWEQEVDARVNLRAVEMGNDIIETIQELPSPGYEEIEPYGWEQDLGRDSVESWTMNHHITFGANVDTGPVYDMAMVLHENSDQAKDIDATVLDYSEPENFISAINTAFMDEWPVHPGAAEAYKELGVWNDDWVEG